MLTRMLDEAIDEVATSSSVRASLHALKSGGVELPSELNIPGGDWLLEAFSAAHSSSCLKLVPLQNIGHAVAAARAAAWAIADHSVHQRDPQAWKQRREAFESGDPMRIHHNRSPEHLRELSSDCRAAWLRLLSRANGR